MKRVKIRFNNVGSIGKILRFDEDISFVDLLRLIVKKLGLYYGEEDDDDYIRNTYRLMLGNDHVEVEDTDDIENGDDLVLQQVVVYDPDDDDDDDEEEDDPAASGVLVDSGLHQLQMIHQHSMAAASEEDSSHYQRVPSRVTSDSSFQYGTTSDDDVVPRLVPIYIGGRTVDQDNTTMLSPSITSGDDVLKEGDASQMHLANEPDEHGQDNQDLVDEVVEIHSSRRPSCEHHHLVITNDSNRIKANSVDAALPKHTSGVIPQQVNSLSHPGTTVGTELRHDGVLNNAPASEAAIASHNNEQDNRKNESYETIANNEQVNQTSLSDVGHLVNDNGMKVSPHRELAEPSSVIGFYSNKELRNYAQPSSVLSIGSTNVGNCEKKVLKSQVAIKIEPMEEQAQSLECLGQFADAETDVPVSDQKPGITPDALPVAPEQNPVPSSDMGSSPSGNHPECHSASVPADFVQVEKIEEDLPAEEEEVDSHSSQSKDNEWIPGFFSQKRVSELFHRQESEDEVDHAPSNHTDGQSIQNKENGALDSSRRSRRKPLKKGHYNVNIMSLVVEAAAPSKLSANKASTFIIQTRIKCPGRNGNHSHCYRVGIQWYKDANDRRPKVHWPEACFKLWRSVDKPNSSIICLTHGYRWFDNINDAKLYACLSFLFKHTEQFGPSPALRRFLDIPDLEEGGGNNLRFDKDIASYGLFVLPKNVVFALGVRSADGATGYFLVDEDQRRASDVHYCKSVGLAKRHGVKTKGMRPFRGIVNHFGPIHNLSKEYKGCSYNVLVRWANGNLSQEPLDSFARKYAWDACYEYGKENRLFNVDGWKFLTKRGHRKKPLKRKRSSFCGRSSSKRQRLSRREQSRGEGTAKKGSRPSTKSRSR